MIEHITEHVEYEKGYLKGFHDGRKWKHEETHDDSTTLKVIERWNKFVDDYVDDKAPIAEPYKQMQSAWAVYNGLPFSDVEWRRLVANNLNELADKIIDKDSCHTEVISSLHGLVNWISTIQQGKTPKT